MFQLLSSQRIRDLFNRIEVWKSDWPIHPSSICIFQKIYNQMNSAAARCCPLKLNQRQLCSQKDKQWALRSHLSYSISVTVLFQKHGGVCGHDIQDPTRRKTDHQISIAIMVDFSDIGGQVVGSWFSLNQSTSTINRAEPGVFVIREKDTCTLISAPIFVLFALC